MTAFRAEPVLDQLKDFQRRTVDYVFARFYEDQPPVTRFLVADEVGLGKTLVARGVIAKTIEHLQGKVERVDIVYVCSNAQIARQNLRRLRVGAQEHFEVADRLTMLPATAHHLAANDVNLISFTPGTSFDLRGGGGMVRERAMLRLVLRAVWGDDRFKGRGSMRVFQGGVQRLETFERHYRSMAYSYADSLDATLVESFRKTLVAHDRSTVDRHDPTLGERFEELCTTFRNDRPKSGWTREERRARRRFIGDLRDLLAKACLDALQPDLIILDEFQRFKHLLAPPESDRFTPAAELAHELFSYVDSAADSAARLLLLSATPYEMLTSAADDDDHHADLVDTIDFLTHHDAPAAEALRRDLRALRHGLLQVGRDGGAAARVARDRVQAHLRTVMTRTERLAATKDRSGMLVECPCQRLDLTAREVERFVHIAGLARRLGAPDPLEYWKSAPFVLNFLEGYKMGEALQGAFKRKPELAASIQESGILPFDRVRRFEPFEFDNSRFRWLMDDTVGRGAWQLLWIPPSLPYVRPSGPFAAAQLQSFTKRLAFSSWTMVPKAVATLLTYEAERRMVSVGSGPRYLNNPEARSNRARPLDFSLSSTRLTGMPVIGLLYPSVELARVGDPLALCEQHGGEPVEADRAVALVAKAIASRLNDVVADMNAEGRPVPREGRADERWYWAAPLWLDSLDGQAHAREFFRDEETAYEAFTNFDRAAGGDGLREHLRAAGLAASEYFEDVGRMPDDLPEVLARMALTAPGVVASRSLGRVTGHQVADSSLRRSACRIAWSLRSLFSAPEVSELVRGLHPGEPYWQRVLDYSLAGNLQAVLDEYAHILLSARGHMEPTATKVVDDLARVMHDTINLRTVNYAVTEIDASAQGVHIDGRSRLRANFALRLSDERDEDGAQTRASDVREAFNSPFWPFVLVTTSAGQEGLDFHPYCHAIVHWNLPSSPVALEQREGRIHRFKGHAVRRNVAADHAAVGRCGDGDPWEAMFDAAHASRDHQSDIVPYWVYTRDGGAAIERYVPALPLSRDRNRADRLNRAVASYRLAFGQPRQDDLLAYLAGEADAGMLERLAEDLRVDLSPP